MTRYWASQGSKQAIMFWPGPHLTTNVRWSWFRWRWTITAHRQTGAFPVSQLDPEPLAQRTGRTWRLRTAILSIRSHSGIVDLEAQKALGIWPAASWTEDI